jgi:hypothetical protein
MRPALLATMAALVCTGCTHVQLQRSTLKQETTLTDLQYKQVLDNLALMSDNPEALPYFALSSSGTAQVADGGNAMFGLTWDPHGLTGESLGLGASRSITESWGLAPVLDPDKLFRMRCAYQWVIGSTITECDNCKARLTEVLDLLNDKKEIDEKKMNCLLPQGWFCVGKKCDVPRDVCYVGHYGDTRVWVNAAGVDGLSRFTLTILNLASASPSTDTVVRKYEGDPDAQHPYGRLKTTEVTITEAPKVSEGATAPSRSLIREIPRINPAVQLTPR